MPRVSELSRRVEEERQQKEIEIYARPFRIDEQSKNTVILAKQSQPEM